MANHTVKVENGRVVMSIVGDAKWAAKTLGGEWVDTGEDSYGDGWLYVDGGFVRDKPHEDWVKDSATGEWVPPVPMPEPVEGANWFWVQAKHEWVAVPHDHVGPPPLAG